MIKTASPDINILVVDDRIEILDILQEALESDGINIYTTDSPTQVINICEQNDIAIALIDVQMPVLDGFSLLEQIKSNPLTKHIMVMLITGYSMEPVNVIKGLRLGAVDYLFKPLDLYITIAKVDSLLTLVYQQREIRKNNIELKRYQATLLEAVNVAEQNRKLKENFLANISHEIRTPLNSITGLAILLKETTMDTEQKKIVNLMNYSAKTLLGIVDDILESSKIDAGKITIKQSRTNILGLVNTVCDLLRPLASEKGLWLLCDAESTIPDWVMADELRLTQILMNLINNAIKFTQKGGINITVSVIGIDEAEVRLEFMVNDSGIGINKASIDKIFNRFEQIQENSWQRLGETGLGLSIVKDLVELMQGEITVESIPGEGTTFTFIASFKIADAETKISESSELLTDFRKLDGVRILLAEDNTVNQFLVSQMLKIFGLELDVANNGKEAIEMLYACHYDLVLMDTHMPVMGGLEATKFIRKNMPAPKNLIPIISFSASLTEEERKESIQAGVSDFIGKPFEPKILHHKMSMLLANCQFH